MVLRVLRWTVALQCVGNWLWLTQIQETPLLHWMLNPPDIGGFGWSEATSTMVQSCVGWMLLPAGLFLAWRANPLVLLIPITFQLANTVAMWQIADGYSVLADWLPFWLLKLFPFATQLLRIGSVLGLFLLCWRRPSSLAIDSRSRGSMEFLRWTAAIVFIAHGIEALQHNPEFIDLIVSSNLRLFGLQVSESAATSCLTLIGVIDVVVGVFCVIVRSRYAMGWMAIWGGVTALSRVAAYGWDVGLHASLVRASHCGVPLAVLLWWVLLSSSPKVADEHSSASQLGAEGHA